MKRVEKCLTHRECPMHGLHGDQEHSIAQGWGDEEAYHMWQRRVLCPRAFHVVLVMLPRSSSWAETLGKVMFV